MWALYFTDICLSYELTKVGDWLQSFVIFSALLSSLSLSLHWFSCQFPSPGARPGCHAPFTAVRISAQKNRKIHKIIPYLTKTLSITQRFGVKRCVPGRNYTKLIFLCVWGWASWLNFPFSYQNVCLVLLSFVLRGWAWPQPEGGDLARPASNQCSKPSTSLNAVLI